MISATSSIPPTPSPAACRSVGCRAKPGTGSAPRRSVAGLDRQSGPADMFLAQRVSSLRLQSRIPRHGARACPMMAVMRTEQEQVIVVAEDEEIVRMILADALRDEGYNVIEAANAEEALLAMERASHIDCLVTDVEMGGPMT